MSGVRDPRKATALRERGTVDEPELDTLEDFVAVDEPGADALLGTPEQNVIPVAGDVMFYGDGGTGKTTLVVDLAVHLAAGVDWLGIPVERPVRVLLIEAEGPRPLFRQKLRRRHHAWNGSPLDRRLIVWRDPWGTFTFADEETRGQLARAIHEREIDLVIVGPLTSIGMEGAGTIQEARAFAALLALVRERSLRRVSFLVVHHENKGGKVSGAWEGVGDALLHVQGSVNGSTRLHFQKVRWASRWTRRTLELEWAPGETFVVSEKLELSDESVAELILDAIDKHPGTSWTPISKSIKGIEDGHKRRIREDLFRARLIVNVVKENRVDVGIFECPERRPSRLYRTDHPDLPRSAAESAAVAPQTELPGMGDGEAEALRRAAWRITPHAVAPQPQSPRQPPSQPHDLRRTSAADGADDDEEPW